MRHPLPSLFLAALLLGGFLLQAAPAPQTNLPKAILTLGTNAITAQIAANDGTRETGLMSRTNLATDEGMLFVFPQPRPVSFWMKDTPVPLSIAYVGPSGRILEIHDLKPLDLTAVPSASPAVAYALEVAQGWFSQHGVLAGDTISGLPPLSAAK